jgi:type I restriction enzyme S subunit
MTALLTDNLPLLAGAPNGIKKLRELILELAVRGKLVEQDASDEPASELLKRIAAEKERLVAEGKIKKQKPLTEIFEADKPFELPVSWEWCRLAQAVEFVNGFAFSSKDFGSDGTGVVKIGDIQNNELTPETMSRVKSAVVDDLDRRFRVEPGDLLIAMSGATTGKLGFNTTEEVFYLNQRVGKIIPICTNARFVFFDLTIKIVENLNKSFGSAIPNLSTEQINDILIALPPLAEQHRIVAKVDELMALCDRLEAQQADAASAHAQLVQALLGSLTQASDATEFAASWQRLAEHFHTLFSTEPSIDALKQTLLQLAVMGKLAPQAPTDEPAEQLLKRISDHRSTYREKKQKSLADISEVEKPFELPCQWVWTTLPAIGELARGKSRHRPRNDHSLYAGGNVPLIQTGDVARANGVVKTHSAMYNAKGVEQSRLWPAGTMCITIAANIADSATLGFDACFPDSVVGFIPEFPELDVRYFEFFLRTAKSHLEDFAPSTAQKNINLEILGLLSVPLPPANEIRRIVAKLDQLIALCDQLKTQLSQARQLNQQLASTLVEQAVA